MQKKFLNMSHLMLTCSQNANLYPPYSPDYNLIEQGFSSIKAFLWQNWQDRSLSVIDRACHNITPVKAAGYFKVLGYMVQCSCILTINFISHCKVEMVMNHII